MEVQLKCFAKLSESDVCDFTGSIEQEISEVDTVESLLNHLAMPKKEIKIIFLNNKIVNLDVVLYDDDQLGLAPPVGAM